jgi:SRSO17 transposase
LRQYTGSAGKITNCQIDVFACYVSRHGHAFVDRALYLPKGWTDNPARMKAAQVPEETAFATKPALAVWAPVGTSIEKLVRVEGCRWAIEDSFETAKNELGLDHNETRSWHGWHRHVSLVMLAFAAMATIRHQANKAPAKPKQRKKIPAIRHLSAGPFRKSAA